MDRRAHPVRVLLVEGDPAARRCVERGLASHSGVVVVGRAAGPEGALAMAGSCGVDVALVNMLLPNANGLALVRRLREEFPHLRVVVTGHEAHPHLGLLARRAGAVGFLALAALTAQELLNVLARGSGAPWAAAA